MKKRVLVAGFGDTGVLVAIHLAAGGGDLEIVGVGPKPCLVSGQELGVRLTRPELWKRDYLMDFARFEKLDGVRIVQAKISKVDLEGRRAFLLLPDGREASERFDIFIIASGVRNGFWRNDRLEDRDEIHGSIAAASRELAEARNVAVVGGGATGVGVAANLAAGGTDKPVHLFHSGAEPLPGYHPKTRRRARQELERLGVHLHPNHRAVIPEGFHGETLTRAAVEWSTGQPPFSAERVLWAIGRVRPNSDFLPSEILDDRGFVRVDEHLQVEGRPGVFALGDVAATDIHRSSARNWGYRVVAHNIRCVLDGRPAALKRFDAPAFRWGSIFGLQENGLQVFQSGGSRLRFPRWAVERLLFPLAVRRAIYKGIRPESAQPQ